MVSPDISSGFLLNPAIVILNLILTPENLALNVSLRNIMLIQVDRDCEDPTIISYNGKRRVTSMRL